MKLETRIFTCFILTLILIFLTGCSTTKWEWLPEHERDDYKSRHSRLNQENKEVGGIKVTVLKANF